MKLFFTIIFLSIAFAANGDAVFKTKEVGVTGRIFMEFEDAMDESVALQADDGEVYMYPSVSRGRVTSTGVVTHGKFQMDLMHRTTLDTVFEPNVIGESMRVMFYTNDNTTMTFEDERGKFRTRGGGSGKVQVTRAGSDLRVTVEGKVSFVPTEEEEEKPKPTDVPN